MKIRKSLKAMTLALVLAVTATFIAPVTLVAATFKDVSATHWGYAAINRVTNLGFMNGDAAGNFNPNGYIDKFEAARILAKMAGYKSTGASAAELEYYTACYNKHIGFINLYVNKFTLWNSTANKEIAFLLEKGILVNDDLNQFVVIVNNRESLRALSREEVAVFFVRLMNRVSSVPSSYSNLFKDDSMIATNAKQYVYYLRSLGVVSGDSANNFSPKGAVVRAAMALMADKVWTIMNPTAVTPPPAPTAAPTAAPTPSPGVGYTSVSGTIGKLFLDFRAVQVSSTDAASNNKIYPAAASVSVTIGSVAKAFADLREGMSFTGVILNGELISIAAVSAAPTPAPGPASVIEGTVSAASGTSISIEVRMINPRGEIYTEIRTFAIPSGCIITRGGTAVAATSITKGEIAKATSAGGILQKLELQVKDRTFTGEVIAKRAGESATGFVPIITVKDSDGNLNELAVTSKTTITRRGIGTVSWSSVRIGDTVDVIAEYEKIVSMYAIGKSTTTDAFVREIHITAAGCEVVAADASTGVLTTYLVATDVGIDIYGFRLGTKVRLYLDSKEIEGYSLLQDTTAGTFTGSITRVSSNVIVIKDAVSGASREFSIDSTTTVRDAATDKLVPLTTLDLNMRVYIAVDASKPTRAKTISILQY